MNDYKFLKLTIKNTSTMTEQTTNTALPSVPKTTGSITNGFFENSEFESSEGSSSKDWFQTSLGRPDSLHLDLRLPFTHEDEYPWFVCWDSDNDTLRLLDDQRSKVSDKTVTYTRIKSCVKKSFRKIRPQGAPKWRFWSVSQQEGAGKKKM